MVFRVVRHALILSLSRRARFLYRGGRGQGEPLLAALGQRTTARTPDVHGRLAGGSGMRMLSFCQCSGVRRATPSESQRPSTRYCMPLTRDARLHPIMLLDARAPKRLSADTRQCEPCRSACSVGDRVERCVAQSGDRCPRSDGPL